jgi:DNA (cytosine-5)-methyltransferase 1
MKIHSDISAVDLFCGAGGLTHGLLQAKIQVQLGVDIDPASQYPFEVNNGAKFLLGDVLDLSSDSIKRSFRPKTTTLLAGCAPCQPFSTYSQKAKRNSHARRDRGKKDDWRLVERFGELIEEVQPDLVAMENVPPLMRTAVYEAFLGRLSGYSVDARVVDCTTVGLPQTRKRLVLVASRLGPISLPHFDRKRQTVRSTIGKLASIEAGGSAPSDRLHRASALSPLNMRRIKASTPGGTWRDWPDDLRADCHSRASGVTYPGVYGRMQWDEPSPTITTQCFGYGNGRFGHPEQHRAISLREASMLQGFPENYSFLREDQEVSFGVLGRLIGNAVPVTLGRAIGELLVDHVAHMSREKGQGKRRSIALA